jgi:hypothetical protein
VCDGLPASRRGPARTAVFHQLGGRYVAVTGLPWDHPDADPLQDLRDAAEPDSWFWRYLDQDLSAYRNYLVRTAWPLPELKPLPAPSWVAGYEPTVVYYDEWHHLDVASVAAAHATQTSSTNFPGGTSNERNTNYLDLGRVPGPRYGYSGPQSVQAALPNLLRS